MGFCQCKPIHLKSDSPLCQKCGLPWECLPPEKWPTQVKLATDVIDE